jgi:SH3-like domain-containing protein
MGGVATGDIVRTFELREGWRHVRHADGREGWLPQNRLVALLDDAPSR